MTGRGAAGLLPLAILAVAAAGCRTPGAMPLVEVVTEARRAPLVPDESDHAAADLAAAAMVGDVAAAARALDRIDQLDAARRDAGKPSTGLVPAAIDLYNASAEQGRAYRTATRRLLKRHDIDPAMRERLEQRVSDDPLALAQARIRDSYHLLFARTFNALVEPVGRSIMTLTLAPYRVASSLATLLLDLWSQEPLNLQHRQALVHWREFLARYPDSPERPKVEDRVESAEKRWQRLLAGRALRAARNAMTNNRANEALIFADRSLHHAPESRRARSIRDEAAEKVALRREARFRSLSAPWGDAAQVLPPGTRELSIALLSPEGNAAAAAYALPDELEDEARFALAHSYGKAGKERRMRKALDSLADCDDRDCNMARHASAELRDPMRNAYGHFESARRRAILNRTTFVLLGPSPKRRWKGLPAFLEWPFQATSIFQRAMAMPLRLLHLPWTPMHPASHTAAIAGRRYLELHPDGERADSVRRWLESYERKRKNWMGALQMARARGTPSTKLTKLEEKAARQAFGGASGEERLDMREGMLARVAREFPETEAGHEAGTLLRREREQASPHRIRLSRNFLEENPEIAGSQALGLDPGLIDGDPTNGELHPDGVSLLGGRVLELDLLDASGDPDDEPIRIYRSLSPDHLARLVARLEEESFENALLDSDEEIRPDAERDLMFERARLGLADEIDSRPLARADFAYKGMRERYGMVRSRESILPFDLVVHGSLTEFSLGAFPRMRSPRKTPDAFLYR